MTTRTDGSRTISLPSRLQDAASWSIERLDDVLGGPARRRVLLTLAGVLAMASADQATIGASATQLRDGLHLDHTDLGLVAAVSGLVAAVIAIPIGSLVDRVNRTRMLAVGVASWSIVMAASAAAQSFLQLVLVRCALGAVMAMAAPACASLIGDFFSPRERGRVWSYVLTGELLGAGFGFMVAGTLASISWRVSFLALAVPPVVVAYFMWRLPEPARGGPGRLAAGATQVLAPDPNREDPAGEEPVISASQQVTLAAAAPYEELVLEEDPSGWPLRRAVRYILRVRTNVYLIVAGAAGYFFLSGARAFGIEYIKPQYGIGQAVASTTTLVLGAFAIVGVIGSGWFSDRMGARGHVRARVYIAAAMLGVAAVLFVPALLVTSLGLGITFMGLAALALAAINPPADAARLDIMHPTLWGRAEAVRSVVKQPAEAIAPLLFGVLADHIAGGGHAGLRAAFLIMLAPLVAAVVVVFHARNIYPRDVATAAASIERSCR